MMKQPWALFGWAVGAAISAGSAYTVKNGILPRISYIAVGAVSPSDHNVGLPVLTAPPLRAPRSLVLSPGLVEVTDQVLTAPPPRSP